MKRFKKVAADRLKAIRRKLVPADNLKRSVAKALLLKSKSDNSLFLSLTPDKVIPDFDVLSLEMLHWIILDRDSTHVVNVNWSLHEGHSIVKHLILDPDDLCPAA
ncbi:hypothetical protein L1987_54572 [Smallanthus sonchifolius]|uniref:Uncharacterized protein n=1 Tax=Smallanthus sonchifolius TaxID=185202 RepID=A0ACB9E8K0_9ASTR|nr:hypothetical protein L1987_54572 [Smallanthus sonchifolius]